MEFKLDRDTIGDFLVTLAGAYLAYVLSGGEPLPILRDFVPWIAAGVVGYALWRHVRKNN